MQYGTSFASHGPLENFSCIFINTSNRDLNPQICAFHLVFPLLPRTYATLCHETVLGQNPSPVLELGSFYRSAEQQRLSKQLMAKDMIMEQHEIKFVLLYDGRG